MAAAGPDIGALLAHLGAGAGPGGPPGQGPPPDQGPSPDDLATQVLDLLHQWFAVENDPSRKQTITQCMQFLTKIAAQDQSDRQSVMGNAPLQRVLNKQA